jgi:hypothetical protein
VELFDPYVVQLIDKARGLKPASNDWSDEAKKSAASYDLSFDRHLADDDPTTYTAKMGIHLPWLSGPNKKPMLPSGTHYVDYVYSDKDEEWAKLSNFDKKMVIRIAKAIFYTYKI